MEKALKSLTIGLPLTICWLIIIFCPIKIAATETEGDSYQVNDYEYYKIIEERNIFKPWRPPEERLSLPTPLAKVNTSGVYYDNDLKQYILIAEDPEKKGTSKSKVGDIILGKKILKIELNHIILLSPKGKEEKITIGDSITEEKEKE